MNNVRLLCPIFPESIYTYYLFCLSISLTLRCTDWRSGVGVGPGLGLCYGTGSGKAGVQIILPDRYILR